ncbi:hypothetical protein PoB_004780200 [Plakobranchus ocellatus]|uniref:Uncharacterized protein n=1 Tax=Plakobranchus ocellatus TaxID=259542 RepID=A0AAV4BPK9_9GAST|nr:hypothetical protein PoB_004780200 [Plakobranchus ocellatus]
MASNFGKNKKRKPNVFTQHALMSSFVLINVSHSLHSDHANVKLEEETDRVAPIPTPGVAPIPTPRVAPVADQRLGKRRENVGSKRLLRCFSQHLITGASS